MGKELFAQRKIDEDTKILSAEYFNEADYDLLVEKWIFDGIRAKSLIFLSVQIRDLSDSQVESLARRILQLPESEKTTFKRKEDFAYFNFGFKL